MLEPVNVIMRHPMAPLLVVGAGIVMGLAGAIISRRKGRSGTFGFALGLVLGPLGVVIALGLKREAERPRPG